MIDVQLGRMVEITWGERRELEEISSYIASESARGSAGWFNRALRAHLRQHRLIQSIITRAHTGSGSLESD